MLTTEYSRCQSLFSFALQQANYSSQQCFATQVCAGILRRYGSAIGLSPTFTIYGADEQVSFPQLPMGTNDDLMRVRYTPSSKF